MHFRKFGSTGWNVGEVGYGMWGLASWKGHDADEAWQALNVAVEMGINFFDTAWAYSAGLSEQILGRLIKTHGKDKIIAATKIPPLNLKWPALKEYALDDCYPADHIIKYAEKSLKNLDIEQIDLLQFHTWHDAWADDERWQEAVNHLLQSGKVKYFGISVNRWEPNNVLKALDTGLIKSVQVVYNIFDQNPEDLLFPYAAQHDIAIIARVPFDEGSLTGMLHKDITFEEGDWRNIYFNPDNLSQTLVQVEKLKKDIPEGMTLPEVALKFILSNPIVSTVIPGMRKVKHVLSNVACSDGKYLDANQIKQLRPHRWVRPGHYMHN
jgi:aryl-alcohol dehydrogenase-like predicted oxidoreductase